MPRLRYCGRDAEGEPIWQEFGIVEPRNMGHSKWKYEDMSQPEKVFMGFQDQEKRGWKSAYSKEQVKSIWGFR